MSPQTALVPKLGATGQPQSDSIPSQIPEVTVALKLVGGDGTPAARVNTGTQMRFSLMEEQTIKPDLFFLA